MKAERVTAGENEIWRETLPNGIRYLTQDLGETSLDDFPPTRMPAGHWFTLGDNRDNSLDSRVTGPSPATQMCGVAVKRI